MRRGLWRAAIAGWLGLALPALAQDPVLTRAGSGARAAGMGNAFVAVSDDGTAASWNPAGLAELRKPELSLVHSTIGREPSWEGFRSVDGPHAFTTARASYTVASPEFASLAVPVDVWGKPVTFQLDWRRLFPLKAQNNLEFVRFPGVQNVDAGDLLRSDAHLVGEIDTFSLAAGVRLLPRTSLGASLAFWRGGWKDTETTSEVGLSGNTDFVTERGERRLQGTNLTLGLLLSYPSWKLGLVYHFPVWMAQSISVAQESNITPPWEARVDGSRMRFPRSMALGLAWYPGKDWMLAADLTRDDWSTMVVDRCPPCGEGETSFFDGLSPELTATRDTYSVNLGAERLFPLDGSVIPVRFGLGYEPQGQVHPVVRDRSDYRLIAAGAGYNTNRFKLDIAVQYRWTRTRTISTFGVAGAFQPGPPGTDPTQAQLAAMESLIPVQPAVGEFAMKEWRVKVSLIYRITDTEKLRAALRRIFG